MKRFSIGACVMLACNLMLAPAAIGQDGQDVTRGQEEQVQVIDPRFLGPEYGGSAERRQRFNEAIDWFNAAVSIEVRDEQLEAIWGPISEYRRESRRYAEAVTADVRALQAQIDAARAARELVPEDAMRKLAAYQAGAPSPDPYKQRVWEALSEPQRAELEAMRASQQPQGDQQQVEGSVVGFERRFPHLREHISQLDELGSRRFKFLVVHVSPRDRSRGLGSVVLRRSSEDYSDQTAGQGVQSGQNQGDDQSSGQGAGGGAAGGGQRNGVGQGQSGGGQGQGQAGGG